MTFHSASTAENERSIKAPFMVQGAAWLYIQPSHFHQVSAITSISR